MLEDNINKIEDNINKIEDKNNKNNKKLKDSMFFLFIKKLPSVLVEIIKEYIPNHSLAILSKIHYNLNHKFIRAHIIQNQIENYIRDIVRRDFDFVFTYILQENYKLWLVIKKYKYKSTIFANYIYFLQDFCIENESNNCRNILSEFIKTLGLSKNQHKKNIIINKRWTN